MHAQCHKGDISCKPLNFKEMKIIRVLPRGLRLFQKWKPGVPFLGHSHHPKCAFSVARQPSLKDFLMDIQKPDPNTDPRAMSW